MSDRAAGRKLESDTAPIHAAPLSVQGPLNANHAGMGLLSSRLQTIVQHLDRRGVIHVSECEELGFKRRHLQQLARAGLIRKLKPGLYTRRAAANAYYASLAALRARAPSAFLCGPTAAALHGLLPTEYFMPIWIGLPFKARRPVLAGSHAVYFSGVQAADMNDVIENGEGDPFAVSSPARCIVEMFKRHSLPGPKLPRIAMRTWRQSPTLSWAASRRPWR